MTSVAINELKKYTLGRKNTEKVEISVLQLNRVIKALEQNSSDDVISREFVKQEYRRRFKENLTDNARGIDLTKYVDSICKEFNAFIDSIPSINPTKTGYWIETETDEPYWYRCSRCNRRIDDRENYCPSCGAKMTESGDEK